MMVSITQDLRYALRTLLHSPGYTAAALLSLGLGIGANTAVFTLTNAIFLHPLPVADPARLLELYTVDNATQSNVANLTRTGISLPNTADIQAQNDVFEGVAAYSGAGVTLTGFGKPTQENGFAVTWNYFDVLGVGLEAGRGFGRSADIAGGPTPEVVVSHGLALRLFGTARGALGRAMNLNSVAYTVIGVAPAGFEGTLTVGPKDPLWLPLGMHAQIFAGPLERLYNERRFRFLAVFARLKPGIDEARALANLKTIAARLQTAYPRDNGGRTFETSSLAEAAIGFAPRNQAVTATIALSAAVGLVLLIACANLANLSLARAARRSREMGIRVALGAARSRLVRQLLAEAAILSAAGGLAGIVIGWAGARLVWAVRPPFLLQTNLDLGLDGRIWLFTAGLSALSCVVFGVAPVFRSSAPDLTRLLNTSGRGNVQGGGRFRVRQLLVVGEIALSLVALIVAGLFMRSMRSAQQLDPGFETNNLAVVGFNLASLQMPAEQGREFMHAMVARAASAPGVARAAVSSNAPLGGGLIMTAFHEGDQVTESRKGALVHTPSVSPDYFDTVKIPLVDGRVFTAFDRPGSARVAIVSQAMATRFWPGERAVGKRLRFATLPELIEVVGVVKDHTIIAIGETPQSIVYMPFDQAYQPFAILHVLTNGAPDRAIPALLAVVQTLNPELALLNPGTVQQLIGQALWPARMAAGLFGLFGVLGLVLAVIGVYGVMAYMVVQRTSEIGIRMAVGAQPGAVVGMVLRQSIVLALEGVVLGMLGALGLTRFVGSLLYGVSTSDPATFAVVAVVLMGTAALAGGVPAVRASRIDPVLALRQE